MEWPVQRGATWGTLLMSRQQHEQAAWPGTRIPVRPADAMRTYQPAHFVIEESHKGMKTAAASTICNG